MDTSYYRHTSTRWVALAPKNHPVTPVQLWQCTASDNESSMTAHSPVQHWTVRSHWAFLSFHLLESQNWSGLLLNIMSCTHLMNRFYSKVAIISRPNWCDQCGLLQALDGRDLHLYPTRARYMSSSLIYPLLYSSIQPWGHVRRFNECGLLGWLVIDSLANKYTLTPTFPLL